MTRLLLVPSVLLVAALLAPAAPAADDPEFGGKKLSAWVKDLSAPDVAARNTALQAIRALGPKATSAQAELVKMNSGQFACGRYWDTLRAVAGDDPAPWFDRLADDNPQVVINTQGTLGPWPLSQRQLEENLLRIADRHAKGKNASAFAGMCGHLEKPNDKLAPVLHKLLDLEAAKFEVVAVALALSRVDPTDERAAAKLLSDFRDHGMPDPGRMEALRRFGPAGLEVTRKRMMFSNGKELNYDFVNALRPSDDPEMGELAAVVKPHLASKFDSQRKCAAWFLVKLGKRAKDAIPDLLSALTRLKDTPDEKLDALEKTYRVEGTAHARALLAAGCDPKELKPFASRIDDLTLREALGEDVTAERAKGLKKQFKDSCTYYDDNRNAGRILESLYAVAPADPDLPELWYQCRRNDFPGPRMDPLFRDGPSAVLPGRGPVPKELLAGLRKEVNDAKRPVAERVTFAVQVVKQDPTDRDAAKLLKDELLFLPEYRPSYDFEGRVRVHPDEVMPAVLGPAAYPKSWPFSSRRYTPVVRPGVIPAFASAGGLTQLVEWLGHEDERVVREALAALGQLGPTAKPAVEKVKGKLKHADPAVKYAAAETLFAIDPTDKTAVPVLLELLSDAKTRAALGRAANPPKWFPRQGPTGEQGNVWAVHAAVEIVFDLDPEAAIKADLYRLVHPSFNR